MSCLVCDSEWWHSLWFTRSVSFHACKPNWSCQKLCVCAYRGGGGMCVCLYSPPTPPVPYPFRLHTSPQIQLSWLCEEQKSEREGISSLMSIACQPLHVRTLTVFIVIPRWKDLFTVQNNTLCCWERMNLLENPQEKHSFVCNYTHHICDTIIVAFLLCSLPAAVFMLLFIQGDECLNGCMHIHDSVTHPSSSRGMQREKKKLCAGLHVQGQEILLACLDTFSISVDWQQTFVCDAMGN